MIDACILTGAGSGIGRALALRLASEGMPVLLVGRAASTRRTVAEVVAIGGRAEFIEGDLTHFENFAPTLVEHLSTRPERRWGAVLACSMLDPEGEAATASAYEAVLRTNVLGNLAVLEAALPRMLQEKYGRVIFFAGGGAAYAYPAFPGYALSKVATVRLVENLAARHPAGRTGCSFVCLAPGAVDTPMLAKVIEAGGVVNTRTAIEEPVGFAVAYLRSDSPALSGRYVHVRDDWKAVLAGTLVLGPDQFLLRRVS